MRTETVLRVVVAKRGRVKPGEFRLREGEIGLSLFRGDESVGPNAILDAVRAAGKQGELILVDIPVATIRRLGLVLASTPGGTPDPAVNRLHVEARFSWWKRVWLHLRRKPTRTTFNDTIATVLAAEATPYGGGS